MIDRLFIARKCHIKGSSLGTHATVEALHHVYSVQRNGWSGGREQGSHAFEGLLFLFWSPVEFLLSRRVFDVGNDRLEETI